MQKLFILRPSELSVSTVSTIFWGAEEAVKMLFR